MYTHRDFKNWDFNKDIALDLNQAVADAERGACVSTGRVEADSKTGMMSKLKANF